MKIHVICKITDTGVTAIQEDRIYFDLPEYEAISVAYEMVWFVFLFNFPVNNFSVILGQSQRFLGNFGNLKMSCSRTLYGSCGVQTLELSLQIQKLYH